jgi:hypothetical protein
MHTENRGNKSCPVLVSWQVLDGIELRACEYGSSLHVDYASRGAKVSCVTESDLQWLIIAHGSVRQCILG